MNYLLGIDIGTSGTKTVLFDEAGHGVASYTGEYPMAQPKNGWAEQDPADWWKAVVDGIRAVLARAALTQEKFVALVYPVRCILWYCWMKMAKSFVPLSCGVTREPLWNVKKFML